MEAKEIYDLLVEQIGEGALGLDEEGFQPVASIAPASIHQACQFLRDDERCSFDMLMCLSGIDWDGYDENGKGKSVKILGYDELGEPETNDRVADGDLAVRYDFFSHTLRHKFHIQVRMPRDVASVPTISDIWQTANWHEREAWDMVGITFEGHPDLRRMLLDDSWIGHPLRKDYQMPTTWANVPLQGQDYAANPFPETPPRPIPVKPETPTPDKSATDKPAEG